MEKLKVEAIKSWSPPQKLCTLRGFLGFCNFYCRFIKDLSLIAKPLHKLTKKGITYKWEKEQEDTFKRLKEAISAEPMLFHPDPTKPYILEMDC